MSRRITKSLCEKLIDRFGLDGYGVDGLWRQFASWADQQTKSGATVEKMLESEKILAECCIRRAGEDEAFRYRV